MEILREKKLPFGISCCYTSQNLDSIGSEEYFDKMVEWGADFVWYFHYMPVGNDAVPELMPTPEQREYMYHKIREVRKTKPIFAMDFQNDAEYVGGCVAGGRRYFHINANGDCDPCVFIHYSNMNIREHSLLEVLQSPIFMAYHNGCLLYTSSKSGKGDTDNVLLKTIILPQKVTMGTAYAYLMHSFCGRNK